IKSNFVSMVVSGADDLISATGKVVPAGNPGTSNVVLQTEVLFGNALNYTTEFRDGTYDKVSNANLRRTIIENLNNNRSTLDQSFDFGDQKIANLRGKWRLVGSGKNEMTLGDGTHVGEFLRLVGNMEGFN